VRAIVQRHTRATPVVESAILRRRAEVPPQAARNVAGSTDGAPLEPPPATIAVPATIQRHGRAHHQTLAPIR